MSACIHQHRLRERGAITTDAPPRMAAVSREPVRPAIRSRTLLEPAPRWTSQ
ncbi:hypothetical protein ACFPRL_23840 [Pseudoclavibacter helvolus]